MSRKEFESWANENDFDTSTWSNGKYNSGRTVCAAIGWDARQPEIYALETENRRLSDSLEAIDLDTKRLVDEINAKDKTIDDLALQKGILLSSVGSMGEEIAALKAEVARLRKSGVKIISDHTERTKEAIHLQQRLDGLRKAVEELIAHGESGGGIFDGERRFDNLRDALKEK